MEQRKSIEGYKGIADPAGGELAHYLIILYHKVIEQCLLKHSKRPSSEEISWCTCNDSFCESFMLGDGLVVRN